MTVLRHLSSTLEIYDFVENFIVETTQGRQLEAK